MKTLTIAALSLIALSGNASEIKDVKITKTMMSQSYGSVIFIKVDEAPSRGSGHCHTNHSWDYVIATESEFGKQMLSQILTAYAAQKTIALKGNDLCTIVNGSEDLTRIELY
ncbi:hypothetical protein [Shewanella sp. YLB-07]|uniref:hypothetical protein n=1 Tax=Shewanella sp. YLB-07 TaxID=2601268 RepID=UPI00128D17A0|nr:hypothetical protein [Shewanella sp. YLB-07]MPY24444.1 hypothetical protein [Shewanella sp. YLB-07]